MAEAVADLFLVEGKLSNDSVQEPWEKCVALVDTPVGIDGKTGSRAPVAPIDDYSTPEVLAIGQSWLDSISKPHTKSSQGLLNSGVLSREKAGSRVFQLPMYTRPMSLTSKLELLS